MNAYASSTSNFGRQMEDWMDHLGEEIRHAAAYVETTVVPEVRREASGALSLLAGHLQRLAEAINPDAPNAPNRNRAQ
jgi:hypothetical protein